MPFRTRLEKMILACACSLLALCLIAGAAPAQAAQKDDGKDDDILVRLEGLRLSTPGRCRREAAPRVQAQRRW